MTSRTHPLIEKKRTMNVYLKKREISTEIRKIQGSYITRDPILNISSQTFEEGWTKVATVNGKLSELYLLLNEAKKTNIGDTNALLSRGDIVETDGNYFIMSAVQIYKKIEIVQ